MLLLVESKHGNLESRRRGEIYLVEGSLQCLIFFMRNHRNHLIMLKSSGMGKGDGGGKVCL